MTLPHVSLGNVEQDIGQAGSSLVRGLLEQRGRQAQLALQEALAKAKLLEADAAHTFPITSPDAAGNLVHGLMDRSGQTRLATGPGAAAPSSQIALPTQSDTTGLPGYATVPRYAPGQPATPVQLPPGTTARQEPPVPLTIEGSGGTPPQVVTVDRRHSTVTPLVNPSGGTVTPRAAEADEQRASYAFEMIQGRAEMKHALQAHPQAYEEMAKYLSALNVGEEIPLSGPLIKAIINNSQSALSPEAAQYFSAFMQFASARAFARGGKTLTRNEIDYALNSLAPRFGEDEQTSAMRDRLSNGIISGTIAGNPAWQRYEGLAAQLGFHHEDPAQIALPQTAPKPVSRYGYQRP